VALSALILAGGHSQRMGRDKALLSLNGTPLIRHTWEVARAVTPQVWLMTSRRDRYSAWLPDDVAWIPEPPPPPGAAPVGPLRAFHQATTSIQTDWVLLLACDLPRLQSSVLSAWQQHLVTLPQETIAYLPKTERGWEPLCGFYRTAASHHSLSAYIATGRRDFQRWLDANPVATIPNVPLEMLANCNTPDDWARLQPGHR
jgi:molybdopterin-guanine dinucleotide biosynthesis protein A